jgi:hypothetical protein
MSNEFPIDGDHPNVEIGHQDEDALTLVTSPDADVMELLSPR